MNKKEFITLFVEELEIEDMVIEESTSLSSIAELDSVGKMVLIGLADEHCGKKLKGDMINSFETMADLMNYLEIE